MPRVLICDKLEAPGLDLLRQAGIELDDRHGLTGAALQEAIRAADGVIVRSGTRITAAELENPGKLRAVVRAGVGVDNIDVAAATRKGIVVMNTPGGNTLSTAEQTLALLFALVRHTPAADESLKHGKWERNRFVGTQLAEEAKQSLDEIIQVSTQIDGLVAEIAQAAVAQESTSRSVAAVMEGVEVSAQATSTESRRVSDALQGLVRVAQDLRDATDRFQVESAE